MDGRSGRNLCRFPIGWGLLDSVRPELSLDVTTLTLNGMGIREATVFNVDVYVAGLYLPEASNDGNAIVQANGLKRIVLHFVRAGRSFGRARP